jgi:hypothetical protein
MEIGKYAWGEIFLKSLDADWARIIALIGPCN